MGKLGMLSSQPKRSWGDSDDEGVENNRPEFTLTEDDWPPTPPKPRPSKVNATTSADQAKARAMARVQASKAVAAGSSSSSSASGVIKGAVGGARAVIQHAKPLAPKPSFTKTDPAKIAPLFRKPSASSSTSSSSTSTIRSSTSNTIRSSSSSASAYTSYGSAAYAANHASTSASTSSSSYSVLPKKRALPWEQIEASSSKSSRLGGTSSSTNFHALNGPGGSARLAPGMKERMLTSDTMDIKQKVILSPEQQMVLKMVVDDEKNVFFTGSAGTGKSVLLREIIASLKRKHRGNTDAVAVTASTGMAACNIGGTTIHSFAGIGIGAGTAEQLIANIKKNRNANAKWQRVKVLVIDEVSMVDGTLVDKLAAIATALKKAKGKSSSSFSKPFGGIQLVVTGDFFQLPPVTKGTNPTFAFEAKAWKDCIDHTVNLTQVFRQKDTEFIDMLNEMRFGRLSQESIKKFYALSRVPDYRRGGPEPTELFPMRSEVERANQTRLRGLQGEERIFKAEDGARDPDPQRMKTNTYLQNFMAPEQLVLKVGAQVMLIKNLDTTLVNGTVGKVVGFGVQELEGEDGEGGDGDDEVFIGADGQAIRVKAEVSAAEARRKQRVAEMVASGKMEMGPVVEWQTPMGIERKTMVREEFKVEDNQGQKLAWRKQYPIILAWAMSIHKSQGQTIARVKVDLGKVFEKGQSYVALSRATSLDGLQVLRFDPKKVAAHDKVVTWSKSLQVLG
ncbi:hypothetical protein JCM11251_001406 [Rhodosporidiobolus azoricus]